MKKYIHQFLLIHLFIISSLSPETSFAKSIDHASLTQPQRDFLHGYSAIKHNDRKQILKYKKKLKGYPLEPYLTYLDFNRNLKNTPSSAILQFINTHQKTHFAHRLQTKWLRHLGKTKQWALYNQHYDAKIQASNDLACYKIQADIKQANTQKLSTQHLAQIKKQWIIGRPLSNACKPLDTLLRKHKKLTGTMLWQNIILAVKKRQISFATRLSQDLSSKERQIYQAWLKYDKNPSLLSKGLPQKMPIVVKKAAFKQTLIRLARKDAVKANGLLKKYAKSVKLTPHEIAALKRQISLRLAYGYKPEAKSFLYEVNQSEASKTTLRWQLQVALKNSDWATILETYELVSPEEQTKNKWQYWLARSLAVTGKKAQAEKIFKKLANKRNFYGFLSADRLKQDYKFNPKSSKKIDTTFLIAKYSQLPRIKELMAIGWMTNANREWHHLLTHVHPNDLNAINYLALDWKQHNVAIRGAAKAKDWNNIDLRFPTPHKGPVMKAASKNKIDPAWVYGIIRRESAFAKDIKSSVGATGLMQLMPKTAKYIGQKLGVKSSKYRDLTNANSNIALGSAYLSYLNKKFHDNRILATAAYNAGPHRVDKWIPKNKLIPADQWVDSIPFSETRKYVKAVMEYTIIFQSLLNKKYNRLENYMPPIGKPSIADFKGKQPHQPKKAS